MFPERYRGGIFIAEHGSWNRRTPIGYRVTFVKVEAGQATSYEPFAVGWLKGSVGSGRPADVLVMPDGALLVSDDKAGRIYRIWYDGR
jgi:glucose/arabinose dehydrogenase